MEERAVFAGFVLLTILTAGTLVVIGVEHAVACYRRFRGRMLVRCPETRSPAAVQVDAMRAAGASSVGLHRIELAHCSRWPERAGCGQACVAQIEEDPEAHRVTTILARWYRGKTCVLCGKPLGNVRPFRHKPAVMSRERISAEWREVPLQQIPELLPTHLPVCWDCHVTEVFRHRFPDLVLDVPPSKASAGGRRL